MSVAYLIPVSPNSQKFSVVLNNNSFNMVLTWRNTPVAIAPPGWFLDIYDVGNKPLILGLGLVTGANLLEEYDYLGLGFKLYIFSEGDSQTLPTYTTLGVSSFLYAVW